MLQQAYGIYRNGTRVPTDGTVSTNCFSIMWLWLTTWLGVGGGLGSVGGRRE